MDRADGNHKRLKASALTKHRKKVGLSDDIVVVQAILTKLFQSSPWECRIEGLRSWVVL